MSYVFAFSYCSWGSKGKKTEVVCHSLLQWTTFCQTSMHMNTSNYKYWHSFKNCSWKLRSIGNDKISRLNLRYHLCSLILIYCFFLVFLNIFWLEDNYFTIWWWFLPYINMNWPQVYMCPPILNSLPTPSLWVVPDNWPWVPCFFIELALVISFTHDNVHVSMLFSQIIPPSPSSTESKKKKKIKCKI